MNQTRATVTLRVAMRAQNAQEDLEEAKKFLGIIRGTIDEIAERSPQSDLALANAKYGEGIVALNSNAKAAFALGYIARAMARHAEILDIIRRVREIPEQRRVEIDKDLGFLEWELPTVDAIMSADREERWRSGQRVETQNREARKILAEAEKYRPISVFEFTVGIRGVTVVARSNPDAWPDGAFDGVGCEGWTSKGRPAKYLARRAVKAARSAAERSKMRGRG